MGTDLLALRSNNFADDVPDGPVAWMDGSYMPLSAAALPVTDLGLHGLAVTEMLRTYNHELFYLRQHLKRMGHSLASVQIPADIDGLDEICQMVARHNGSFIQPASDLGLVAFVTAGANPTYVGGEPHSPTVCVHTFELPLSKWSQTIQHGVHLVVSSVRQIPSNSVPSDAKTRSRLHWYLASQDVRQRHATAQPILLNQAGDLTETPSGNFFAVYGESVVTPPDDVLPGISRLVVSELCRNLGLQYEERRLTAADIADCDEAFLSSTPYGLLPVTRFEENQVGNGLPGPVFFELCNAWSELVGIDIIEQVMVATT